MLHSEITVVKLFCATFSWLWFFASCLHYCDKKCDNWGCNSRPYDSETYALSTAPLSLSPLWRISEVIGVLNVDAVFRNNTVVKLSFVLLLVGSCFSSSVCITETKSATSEDRTHDLKIMRPTRCRLRRRRCLFYGASVKLLEPCTFMRHSGITLLSNYFLCCFWLALVFPPPACIIVTKSATSEDRTHDLTILRLTRCRLRHCRCLRYGASVKLLEPCT